MPVGLHGLYPVVYNNSIYVLGGGPNIDRGASDTLLIYTRV